MHLRERFCFSCLAMHEGTSNFNTAWSHVQLKHILYYIILYYIILYYIILYYNYYISSHSLHFTGTL